MYGAAIRDDGRGPSQLASLLARYLKDWQYHATHVCYNLTLPDCPVTPIYCTRPLLFAVYYLAGSRRLCCCAVNSTHVIIIT